MIVSNIEMTIPGQLSTSCFCLVLALIQTHKISIATPIAKSTFHILNHYHSQSLKTTANQVILVIGK